jgi:hypothetical protein
MARWLAAKVLAAIALIIAPLYFGAVKFLVNFDGNIFVNIP